MKRTDCVVLCYQKHHDQLCNGTELGKSPRLIRESILKMKTNIKLYYNNLHKTQYYYYYMTLPYIPEIDLHNLKNF